MVGDLLVAVISWLIAAIVLIVVVLWTPQSVGIAIAAVLVIGGLLWLARNPE